MKPTIGRIVRFVDDAGAEWPAIVTVVYSDTVVSLQVFRLSDIVAVTSVPYSEKAVAQGFSWHWPERA